MHVYFIFLTHVIETLIRCLYTWSIWVYTYTYTYMYPVLCNVLLTILGIYIIRFGLKFVNLFEFFSNPIALCVVKCINESQWGKYSFQVYSINLIYIESAILFKEHVIWSYMYLPCRAASCVCQSLCFICGPSNLKALASNDHWGSQ